ncbi:MAG: MobV family relaxase [Parachlamydiaceae bacterium]
MYQAIDIKKYKTSEQITNVTAHNLRTSLSNNVNPAKIHKNKFFIGSADMDFQKELDDKLATCGKFRKDAVKVVNLVFSASPDFFRDSRKTKEWEILTQNFVEETFGKENILYSVVHYDEKTPHFHISIIPRKDGKLNASHWFDGRAKLSHFHDNYNKTIKHLGLKRGEQRKKPTYTELDDYYKKVNASVEYGKKIEEKVNRILTHIHNPKFAERLNPWGFISNTLKPYIVNMGKTATHLQEKAKRFDAVARKLQKAEEKLGDYELKFDLMGLNPNIKFSECEKFREKIYGPALAAMEEPTALNGEDKSLEYIPNSTEKNSKPR